MIASSLLPYCKLCWFPSSKPNFFLDAEGICRACRNSKLATGTLRDDWHERSLEFSEIVKRAIARKSPHFDIVVPVSGGKDSITQVVRANQFGARILAISVDYGVKTEIGRFNLNLVPGIGDRVHLQVYRPPLRVHRELILRGLRQFGDPDLFSHTLLHAYPLHQALALDVPLVVLGENSADVYGGSADIANLKGMTRSWFETYAVSGNHSVMHTGNLLGFDSEELRYYDFPDAIEDSDTKTVFLSSYFPWDSETHLQIAKSQGFMELKQAREGTFRSYVGIDEHINRIHQYIKFLKFGYGRTTDHVCEEIRLGRITREQGRQLILKHELAPPTKECMEAVANFLQVSTNELASDIEKWRDPAIWLPVGDHHFKLVSFLETDEGSEVESLISLY